MHHSPRPGSNLPNCSCPRQLHCANRRSHTHNSSSSKSEHATSTEHALLPTIQLDLLFHHTKSDDTLKFSRFRNPKPQPRTRSRSHQMATPPEKRQTRAHQAGGRRTRRRRRHGRPARGGGGRRPPRRTGRVRPSLRRPSPRYLSPLAAARSPVWGGGGLRSQRAGGDCGAPCRRSWKRDLGGAAQRRGNTCLGVFSL